MALRHLWIVSVALLNALCRFGNRASLGWPLGLMSRYRMTQTRSTCSSLSAYQWTLLPTLHDRMAWKLMPSRCLWTLVADDKWISYSLQVLPLAFRLLERRLVPVLDWREAMWWMVNQIVVAMQQLTELLALLLVVRSVHQHQALQNSNLEILNKEVISNLSTEYLQRPAAFPLCNGDCWLAVVPVNEGCVIAANVRRFWTDIGPNNPAAAAADKLAAVFCCACGSCWAPSP